MTEEKYPEYIEADDEMGNQFEYIDIDVGTYKEDFEEAYKVAKKKNGQVYTKVDAEDNSLIYVKGVAFVNRLGVSVLIREAEK